jgi:hypothetical protein
MDPANRTTTIAEIGPCIGCARPARLDDSVCRACLERRGRRWAEMSHRCRTDPAFARAVYGGLTTARAKALFRFLYGERVLEGKSRGIAQGEPAKDL